MLFFTAQLIAAAFLAACAVHVFRSAPHKASNAQVDLPSSIPLASLAAIEQDLKNLKRVVVITDTVQKPAGPLLDSVESNFARGVSYLFIVSKDRGQDEVNGYFRLFEALASVVTARRAKTSTSVYTAPLVDIQQLTYNWLDFSIIFYEITVDDSARKILAFRGDRLYHGIADHYSRVAPDLARTILRAVVSDAPTALQNVFGEESKNLETFKTPPLSEITHDQQNSQQLVQ